MCVITQSVYDCCHSIVWMEAMVAKGDWLLRC